MKYRWNNNEFSEIGATTKPFLETAILILCTLTNEQVYFKYKL